MNKFFQSGQEYLRGLFLSIQESKKDIYFCAYAVAFSKQAPALNVWQVLEELVYARKRGVQVFGVFNQNINLPQVEACTKQAFSFLQDGGCEVFWFPKNRILHSKIFVIDNYQVFIGSQNLTEASKGINIESSVLIEDSELAGRAKNWIALLSSILE